MKIYIKEKKRRKEEFQFFMHDFVDVCKREGFSTKPDIIPDYKWHYRALLRDTLYHINKNLCRMAPSLFRQKEAVLIASNGFTIKDVAFPYFFRYEIIPFLWDVWPASWPIMKRDFDLFRIKTVFVTVRSVANKINSEMSGVKAFWIPEGIEVSHYLKGDLLVDRPYNILEMGRQMKMYHEMLCEMHQKKYLTGWTTSLINSDGTLSHKCLSFADNEILYQELPKYKILVCFPQCDTNPTRAGNLETLTQRYWEAMLSGCLMIGRAPQELKDIIGYNPVIDVNWQDPQVQLKSILNNISGYQSLIEKNYEVARKHAPWESRIDMIKVLLEKNGYNL